MKLHICLYYKYNQMIDNCITNCTTLDSLVFFCLLIWYDWKWILHTVDLIHLKVLFFVFQFVLFVFKLIHMVSGLNWPFVFFVYVCVYYIQFIYTIYFDINLLLFWPLSFIHSIFWLCLYFSFVFVVFFFS